MRYNVQTIIYMHLIDAINVLMNQKKAVNCNKMEFVFNVKKDGKQMNQHIFALLFVEILLLKDMRNVILVNIQKMNMDANNVTFNVKMNAQIANLAFVIIAILDGNYRINNVYLIVETIKFKDLKNVMI